MIYGFRVAEDDAAFPPRVEFDLAKALAAYKCLSTVADNGARMQPQRWLAYCESRTVSRQPADKFHLHTRFVTLHQNTYHRTIPDLTIKNDIVTAWTLDASGG